MGFAQHENLILIKSTMSVEGREPIDFPILDAESISAKIPEGSKYRNTLYFKVQNKPLKNFRYHQDVKKAGLTVKTRDLEFGDFEPSDEIYSVEYPEDETPSGFFSRGHFSAYSSYYAGDELLISHQWSLEICKK
ncbi:uncharacterized protein J8A68_004304 [[Candida] subhashii]|uniref:Uncharacterized protein n=1 Tax=[Candida] subhashii TaxID=561895 RepID=A0A8J5UKP0_9ASCO|nr:uncharacterized protein J8A68_004304 [[Candida] subhashii]KAG7662176.1 hypothetical protein J8A68_004304 [[Candida] subhashii]